MIIVLKPGVTHEQVEEFSSQLQHQHNVKVNAWYGEHSVVLGLLGDTATVDIESVGAQDIATTPSSTWAAARSSGAVSSAL